jgi:hypothetical protein
MESVRKDIECCFGILKMRFRILAHPLQFHSKVSREVYIAKHNNVVWGCAILHNLLLGTDGERVCSLGCMLRQYVHTHFCRSGQTLDA